MTDRDQDKVDSTVSHHYCLKIAPHYFGQGEWGSRCRDCWRIWSHESDNPTIMKIIFRDRQQDIVDAVAHAFTDVDAVHAESTDIFAAPIGVDAIISPANSFGWMDGGIDLVYRERFGFEIEQKLRSAIFAKYDCLICGMPVGHAMAIPTGDNDIPHMISAPTMVKPGPAPHTINAYLAFRAALRVAIEHGFHTLLCPGLGTGTGMMTAQDCAKQMCEAWDETWLMETARRADECPRKHHA